VTIGEILRQVLQPLGRKYIPLDVNKMCIGAKAVSGCLR
jgi:hypothetical protein